MEIVWSQAILAGVIGSALMALGMLAGRVMGLSTDMVRMLGLFVLSSRRPSPAIYLVGLLVHLVMGAIFGVIYALLFTSVGVATLIGPSALWGILFGALHGVVIGALLGVLPAVHPQMGGEGAVLESPGFFGYRIGIGMPVALILLHVIYGVAVGVIYSVGVVS